MLSLVENMSPEERVEEEKRRKREKVAKLHRFLGSRVPTELVVKPVPVSPLPPVAPGQERALAALSEGEGPFPPIRWVRRRRNSIATSDPLERLPDSERMKEELSETEKALVVKRAYKMERVRSRLASTDPRKTGYANYRTSDFVPSCLASNLLKTFSGLYGLRRQMLDTSR